MDIRIRTALIAVALALGAQALTVEFNYHGDWSGLFCAGDRQRFPTELPQPFLVKDSWGYDGQAYRLIAYDPLFRRGFAQYIDSPRLRYNRILVSGLANLLAFGRDRLVQPMYIAVMLGFVGLGSFFLAGLASRFGWPRWAGLLFLAIPATLVGLDRMTIDLALAALCLAYVALKPGSAAWFLTLAAAALCRETGFLLIGAAVWTQVRERNWRLGMFSAASAIPALAWLAFVAAHTKPIAVQPFHPIPLYGLAFRLLHPAPYSLEGWRYALVQTFDYLALLGAALALAGLWQMRRKLASHPELVLFALPFLFVGSADVWSEPYAYGRTMTPLWLFLGLWGNVERRQWICLAPLALIDSMIGLQLAAEAVHMLRSL